MDEKKKKRLEKKGYSVGSADDFLSSREIVYNRRVDYLDLIERSVGNTLFRTCFYVDSKDRKTKIDVCQNGKLACARFVSCILKLCDLVSTTHVGVGGADSGLEGNMRAWGWKRLDPEKKIPVGAVVFWEAKKGSDGKMHRHVGFYMGNGRCISGDPDGDVPIEHDTTFGGTRNIEKVYIHNYIL